jgi:hypothetical protein
VRHHLAFEEAPQVQAQLLVRVGEVHAMEYDAGGSRARYLPRLIEHVRNTGGTVWVP